MEEKILLSNETQIDDMNFKNMMLYQKFHKDILLTITKIGICIFIITASIVLDIHRIDKLFCVFIGILGIRDTLKVKENRIKDVDVMKYDFFENYFHANNKQVILEIPYTEIDAIVDLKEYYYFIIAKVPMLISKNGFTKGTGEELKQLVKCKKKGVKYENMEWIK